MTHSCDSSGCLAHDCHHAQRETRIHALTTQEMEGVDAGAHPWSCLFFHTAGTASALIHCHVATFVITGDAKGSFFLSC